MRACSDDAAYSAPAAACSLSPKQARYRYSGTCAGSLGEVAPEVTKNVCASAATGAAASTAFVSLSPSMAAAPAATSSPVRAWSTAASVSPSAVTRATRRPSTPPAALICSTARAAPLRDGTSSDSCPPVRLKIPPSWIGPAAAGSRRTRRSGRHRASRPCPAHGIVLALIGQYQTTKTPRSPRQSKNQQGQIERILSASLMDSEIRCLRLLHSTPANLKELERQSALPSFAQHMRSRAPWTKATPAAPIWQRCLKSQPSRDQSTISPPCAGANTSVSRRAA